MEAQNISPETIEQLREETDITHEVVVFTGPFFSILSVLPVIVGLIVVLLLHALYFKFVGSALKISYSYKHWLSLVALARIPAALLVLAMTILAIVFMAKTSNPLDYSVLALAWWLPIPNETHPILERFVYGLDVALIWTIALLTIGFRTWTNKSVGVSLTFVGLPYLIVYGAVLAI